MRSSTPAMLKMYDEEDLLRICQNRPNLAQRGWRKGYRGVAWHLTIYAV
jgi:hypothetical protein